MTETYNDIDCCITPLDCPGTCDYCGFSLCPEAQDVDMCDGCE